MSPKGVLYAVDPILAGTLGFNMQAVIAKREVSGVEGVRCVGSDYPEPAAARVLAEGPLDLFSSTAFIPMRLWQSIGSVSAGVAPNGLVALHDSASSSERSIEDAGSVKYTREHVRLDARYSHVGTVDTLTLWRRLP
jgi:hypothetical protein